MHINDIQLNNFRNFTLKKIEFSPKISVLVGPNASGKTNIIEGIFLLSTGKSFRARVEEEMINYTQEIARVKATTVEEVGKKSLANNLEVVITRGEISVGDIPRRLEKVARKKLLVNGISKRLIDFAGTFKAVLFGPWDMELVTNSPSIRRKFLDTVLSQVDREYRRAVLSYEKGLRQRNKLLLDIREKGLSRNLLLFWNKLLIKNGDYIAKKREEFIEFVNSYHFGIVSGFFIEYDKSAISEARLEQYAEEEIAAGATLVGPHRDEMIFKIKDGRSKIKSGEKELSLYGSRGEQRMCVLWLKLAELSYIEKVSGEKPVLLLDDIFSELDHEHRKIVFEIAKNQQTIITTADPHFVEDVKEGDVINLK